MYGCCNVWVCVCEVFVLSGCVCVCIGFEYMVVCKYGFFNVWVCLCMGFVMSGFVYVWVF